MSLETWQAKYPVVIGDEIVNLRLREALTIRKESDPASYIWSARLSTGIFGLHDCPAGNSPYAPKGENEVILALGDEGLNWLIDLGFLPCPACHPENTLDFWEKTQDVIKSNLGTSGTSLFMDRNIIPFDASRVDWYMLAPHLTSLPNRLYVPPNLTSEDLYYIKDKMSSFGFKLPPIGYYDRTSPNRFTEYNLNNVF